ncbi:MAG: DUF4912 domain-containing protein [Planctomycetaceae bacterium]|nr:DUF4912 domain-containing protein [Planctomycetaceae bacterium]
MPITADLNTLTAKELGSLAKGLSVSGWHEMRKEELLSALSLKLRTKAGREVIQNYFDQRGKNPVEKPAARPVTEKRHSLSIKPAKVIKPSPKQENTAEIPDGITKKPKKLLPGGQRKEAPQMRELSASVSAPQSLPEEVKKARRNIGSSAAGKDDKLVLLVRDPYWLHVFWEVTAKSIERAKAAMGPSWHTAIPVLRLFRLISDGSANPQRQHLRSVVIHSGVNNWYLDVDNPPSAFIVELGYLSREKKFHLVVSSNTVETPQHRVIDELEKLDGNWKGVADDLGRVFKLSGGNDSNSDLKKVFEEQLGRSVSSPLLSRYQASKYSSGEQTQRNFQFDVDADVIIHGKTSPNVLISIRNEPIPLKPDGTFSVRFSLPEKRHMFQVKAEGSDGVETQQVILSVERNTRVLETLIQEPSDDD